MIVLLYRVNEHKWAKSIVLCCLLLHCITLNTYTVPDLCNKHFKCAIFVCVKLLFIIIIVSIWKVWTHACVHVIVVSDLWELLLCGPSSVFTSSLWLWMIWCSGPRKQIICHPGQETKKCDLFNSFSHATFPWLWYGQLATFCIVVMCTHVVV